MLDSATKFYGSCVLWQCESHRKERPHFLWCPRCCGPGAIRTHTHRHGCTPRHEQIITTQIHATCTYTPSSADHLPRGLALINSLHDPTSSTISHIPVCFHLHNYLHSLVQLKMFALAALDRHYRLLGSNWQIIPDQINTELFELVMQINHLQQRIDK